MVWTATPAALILWTTAALALAVAWIARQHNPFPGKHTFAWLMLAVAEWALFAGLEAAAIPLSLKLVLSKVEYVGLAATPILFLTFSAEYSGHDRWLRTSRLIMLWLTALIPIVLASTNELHHWLWAQYVPGPPGSNSILFLHGPAYYVVAAQVYLFVLAGCVLVAQSALHHARPRRRQARVILLASAVPLVAGILYIVDVSLVPGLDLIPVSFFMTGLIFLIGIGLFRVFDLVPAARNALIEQTSDAVIVADDAGRVVDANPTATHWFSKGSPLIGSQVAEVLGPWP